MKKHIFLVIILFVPFIVRGQDLSQGLMVNDLENHPMQDIAKPGYLQTITDPSFGTTIRRISDAGAGNIIKPIYSTIQGWNADESLLMLYDVRNDDYRLLDGFTYQPIRVIDDISPTDDEDVFWDFNNPDIFYYTSSYNATYDFTAYNALTGEKTVIVSLKDLITCSTWGIGMGGDVQMMSWDSDVFTFICSGTTAYGYQISTGEKFTFDITDAEGNSPAVAPSGQLFYHNSDIYNGDGEFVRSLNESNVEHSCIGRLANGHDAYFTVAFDAGPQGGCSGNVIVHDLTTGECYPVISQGQGYPYAKSGTHISALAHKNTEGGWVAASMMGFQQDGQSLLDQELIIAKTDQNNIKVCRIGHHRADEDEFDYYGEPHASISPTGTRVLFASDWSGDDDGESVDTYVVELPSYNSPALAENGKTAVTKDYSIFPNPTTGDLNLQFNSNNSKSINLYDQKGQCLQTINISENKYIISFSELGLSYGIYYITIKDNHNTFHEKVLFVK